MEAVGAKELILALATHFANLERLQIKRALSKQAIPDQGHQFGGLAQSNSVDFPLPR
jgi:hypothetical protein